MALTGTIVYADAVELSLGDFWFLFFLRLHVVAVLPTAVRIQSMLKTWEFLFTPEYVLQSNASRYFLVSRKCNAHVSSAICTYNCKFYLEFCGLLSFLCIWLPEERQQYDVACSCLFLLRVRYAKIWLLWLKLFLLSGRGRVIFQHISVYVVALAWLVIEYGSNLCRTRLKLK